MLQTLSWSLAKILTVAEQGSPLWIQVSIEI
jgi:hypothetical protein